MDGRINGLREMAQCNDGQHPCADTGPQRLEAARCPHRPWQWQAPEGKHRRASGGRLSRQGMLRTCLACTSGRPCAVCVHNRFMVLKRHVPCPPHTDSLIPARHLRRRTLLALCAVGRLRLRRNGVSVVRALCVPAIAPLAFAPSGRGEAPCMGRGHSDQPHSPASQGQGQASFQLDGCCDLLLAHP